jgi:hypothetical protein
MSIKNIKKLMRAKPMAKHDFFAEIALEQKQEAKEELCRQEPLKYEKPYFGLSKHSCERIIEKSCEEQLTEFNNEIERLRQKFMPFVKDCTPPAQVTRKSMQLNEFKFRYEQKKDRDDIRNVLTGKGEWDNVIIPDYRGPVGRWIGYYRTVFTYDSPDNDKRIFIKFLGVDYIANVYLNSRHVGSHEGFFAPFEFDITDYLKYHSDNVLVVEVKNDYPTVGMNYCRQLNGNKIYAATGLGWDDPEDGWHHCPPGAGIYNSVIIEERSEVFVDSVFVRPDIDDCCIEVHANVFNPFADVRDIKLLLSVYPFNFEARCIENMFAGDVESAGPGINYYRFRVNMPGYRLWQCDEPWLYTVRVSLKTGDEKLADEIDSTFGMRKFHMDESAEEKGRLYLNNKPLILRGANDMGHMQQCVVENDPGKLIDDILIAKLANMNFYRFTQRPVQEEIYHFCDMLGMMNQTDFPLFGYFRRNQLCEALKQVGEMERLIRNHPSSVMVTYINEPFCVTDQKLGHRHLYRDELEAFFESADRIVKAENPDRIIKHVEGDYDPPTRTGLSDFHCYNMWYTNHAIPIGKLYKGYLPNLKKGWKTGCGEYGTEGLDNFDLMKRFYPPKWLSSGDSEEWTPESIVLSQTNSMHGDWFEEQSSIYDWINASQKHQAFAAKIMTDALRRRSDKIVSTALHLLIDAWPAGWMKALVGVDRIPKPAYFSFRKSLIPVRVNLRCDRWKAYAGEIIDVEAWYLNDTSQQYPGCKIIITLRDEKRDFSSYEISLSIAAVSAAPAGVARAVLPDIEGRKDVFLDAKLVNCRGEQIDNERFTIEVFKKDKIYHGGVIAYIGENARKLLESLGISAYAFDEAESGIKNIFISDEQEYYKFKEIITDMVVKGARAIFINHGKESLCWKFSENTVNYKDMNGLFFIARDKYNSFTKEFHSDDFSYWYNDENEIIDYSAVKYMESNDLTPILYTYMKPGFHDKQKGKKKRLPIVGEISYGKGKAIFISLCLNGRVGKNPVLDKFLRNLCAD